MTTALIIGGVLLVGVGMVSSQLFRLKDWLNRQPAVPNPEPDWSPPAAADGAIGELERPGDTHEPEQPGPAAV
jgi:hypothetical protein